MFQKEIDREIRRELAGFRGLHYLLTKLYNVGSAGEKLRLCGLLKVNELNST